MNSFRFFIPLFSLLTFALFGQESERAISFEKRIELDFEEDEQISATYAIGEEGLLLYVKKDPDIKGEGAKYTINKYDVNLEKVNEVNISVPYKKFNSYTDKTDGHFYNLFINRQKKSNEVTIFKIDQTNLNIKETRAMLPPKAYADKFVVVGNMALISGMIKKEEFLVTVDIETGRHNIVPLTFAKLAGCKRISVNSVSKMYGTDDVLLFVSGYVKKEKKVLVVTLNNKGEKTNEFMISEELDKTLVSISGNKVSDINYIFTGTYSSKNSPTSEGIYICKTKGNDIEYINFTNYLDLSNFTSYLSEKKQEKLEKKKKKKESKGKELKLNYFVASHRIINMDDGYLYIGECYYPTYRTETRTTYINGRPTTTYVTVFDGYQYTHALLVKYNEKGQKVWDEIFDMSVMYKPYYVKRFIHIAENQQESLKLAYATGNRIYSKEFDWNGKLLHEENSSRIETETEGDKVKYTTSTIDFWYDNYFLGYGSQKIKNKENDKVKKKRIIYYLTKIKF